jgi:hypothetical protein
MKTAISIDDNIYQEAELTASQMGLSRSKLYALAICEFVKHHKPDAITTKLNDIYSNQPSRLDNDIQQASFDLFAKEDW